MQSTIRLFRVAPGRRVVCQSVYNDRCRVLVCSLAEQQVEKTMQHGKLERLYSRQEQLGAEW